MATLESQYWKFLEQNPGSTLTFEEWKIKWSNELKESIDRINKKNDIKMATEIERLQETLENFEMVRYRINTEGFHYCFKHYSSFMEIEDKEFHELREKYLDISSDLEKYVQNKIEQLNNRINDLEDELAEDPKPTTFDLYQKYKDEFAGYEDVPSYDWFLHELRFNDKFKKKYGNGTNY